MVASRRAAHVRRRVRGRRCLCSRPTSFHRHARPCAGHPRREAAVRDRIGVKVSRRIASRAQCLGVDGRVKPGHDGFGAIGLLFALAHSSWTPTHKSSFSVMPGLAPGIHAEKGQIVRKKRRIPPLDGEGGLRSKPGGVRAQLSASVQPPPGRLRRPTSPQGQLCT
jgi:hypothetical protein